MWVFDLKRHFDEIVIFRSAEEAVYEFPPCLEGARMMAKRLDNAEATDRLHTEYIFAAAAKERRNNTLFFCNYCRRVDAA
jgi:hypothetical protein